MLAVDTDTLRPIYGRVTYPPSPNTQIIFTDGVVCREGKAVVLALMPVISHPPKIVKKNFEKSIVKTALGATALPFRGDVKH